MFCKDHQTGKRVAVWVSREKEEDLGPQLPNVATFPIGPDIGTAWDESCLHNWLGQNLEDGLRLKYPLLERDGSLLDMKRRRRKLPHRARG